jgi:phosphatidylglycerophosphate synthase
MLRELHLDVSRAAGGDTLFPQHKRRYQSAQLMNLLLRAPLAPLIRGLCALGLRGDTASLLGMAAYGTGAGFFIAGSAEQRGIGLAIFSVGMLLEFVDGGLARLRGPSPIGHFLAKILESGYIMLLAPALAIGMFRHGDCGLAVLLLGVLGASAHLQFRATIEAIGIAHPEADLARWADAGLDELRRFVVAQFLPQHGSFQARHRALRILRENVMESSGVQPLLLVAAVLSGRTQWFVIYYGAVQLTAWTAMMLLKLMMLRRGGGRLLVS